MGHHLREPGEHLPHRSTISNGPDDRACRLQSRPERGEFGERDIRALELPGRGEHVRREIRERSSRNVDDREDVEGCERGAQPLGLRERGQGIAAGHEQRANVAGFDLVDERDRGELAGDAWHVGAAARRREHSCGPRAATKGPKQTTVKLHAGRAVERARRDQDDPAQPLGNDAVARHRHPGAALHRDVPGSGA